MARIEKTVFISYRRADVYTALAVYQDLTSKGYDVFFDYTSISSGDFEQIILSNIRARAHFVLILTPTALDRCNEPGDWLRREIENAIDEERNIVPLFFKGFKFGTPAATEKLTGKLANLGRYNGLNVHEDYFRAAMDRLSEQFLDVPLETVLHPVSTEVRKAVKKEQIAVNNALLQRWEEIKEILKPAEENLVAQGQTLIETVMESSASGTLRSDGTQRTNLRFYGIGAGILLIVALGIAGINAWINGGNEVIPTMTNQVVSNTTTANSSLTSPVDTATFEIETPTPTEEPTLTITPSPTLGISSTMISPKDNMILVYIPAGKFRMGFQGQESDEKPIHAVDLDVFWIDQTEVTNAMYALCVNEGDCNRPGSFGSRTHPSYYGNPEFDEYPVIYVSWEDADNYCKWASRTLPTESQWEKAARGTDQRSYPWGEQIDCSRANYFDGNKFCVGDTSPVKSYESGKSYYGLYDMAGNVWEWVADWYDEDYYDIPPTPNPLGPSTGIYRVARGGSWSDTDFLARSSNRGSYSPKGKVENRGFRCALSK